MQPYVAPHTAKIHTLITLGIRHRIKSLVLKARKKCPRGFDSHRPLQFSLPGVSLRCPGTRLSLSPSSHSLDAAPTGLSIAFGRVRSRRSHWSVIDPEPSSMAVRFDDTKGYGSAKIAPRRRRSARLTSRGPSSLEGGRAPVQARPPLATGVARSASMVNMLNCIAWLEPHRLETGETGRRQWRG
jgi:hypothetical protein